MEINFECPIEIADSVSKVCANFMEEAGKPFCPQLPMPVDINISNHWIH
jgi:DNA polymerase I-like protein with 3'-5' exonuclease and polymerase domains